MSGFSATITETVGAVYMTANAFDTFPAWLTGDVWYEMTGWFKGAGAVHIQPSTDSQNPTHLPTGTIYITPTFVLN